MKKNDNIIVAGKMMILIGIMLIIPCSMYIFYPYEISTYYHFMIPGLLSIMVGFLLQFCSRRNRILNSNRIVVFTWMYGFLLAAVPFMTYSKLTFAQALFESVSGFTTTGLSVLDVSVLPHVMLFYRGFLQYMGGVGFVMMMLIFVQGKNSVGMFHAEGHPDRLMPNIGKTAKVIFAMYFILCVIGTILYTICGMPLFDSLVHTMCALSTGGFANKLDSIGAYHSLPIEIVTIILMLLGTTNFSLLLLLFKGKFKKFCKSSEMRFLAVLSIISIVFMTVFLTNSCNGWEGCGWAKALRYSVFNAFSATSTTGYSTCSYTNWPETALLIMIILMVIGGGIGSTAGGIKLGRMCIACKYTWLSIKKKILPERQITLSYYNRGTSKDIIEGELVNESIVYIMTYMILYIAGTLMLACSSGATMIQSAFEFASAIGTVGLSIGITSMTTSSLSLTIMIVGMILGRLEIFVIFKALIKKGKNLG